MLRCFKCEEKNPLLKEENNIKPVDFPSYVETETKNGNGI